MEAAAQPIIKVAAICGSLRKGSYNRGLIRSAIQLTKESVKGMEIEYLDISPLPMLNTDLEVDGTYPPVVEAFRKKILAADCYLFASPEYNYSVTGPLKNAIDWASRPPNVWADKAAAIVSAGGGFGGGRAQYHLRQIGVYLDLHFINKPEFFLNAFAPPAKFDSEGNLIDEATKEKLKEILIALRVFTLRLQGQRESPPTDASVFLEDFDDVEDDKHLKDFRQRNSPPISTFVFPEDLVYNEDDKQPKDFGRRNSPPIEAFFFPEDFDDDEDAKQMEDFGQKKFSPIDAFIFPEDLEYDEDDKQPKDFVRRNSPPIDAFVSPEDFVDDEDAKQTKNFGRKNSPPLDAFIFPEDLDDDENDDAPGCKAYSMPINHDRRSDCQQGSI